MEKIIIVGIIISAIASFISIFLSLQSINRKKIVVRITKIFDYDEKRVKPTDSNDAWIEDNNIISARRCFQEARNSKDLATRIKLYEKAIEILNKIDESSPSYTDRLNLLGVIYGQLGNHEKAKNFFEQALQISPDDIQLSLNIGRSLFSLKEYELAENIVSKIETDNEMAQANRHALLAYIREKLGCQGHEGKMTDAKKLSEACDHMKWLINRWPETPGWHLNLGLYNYKLDNIEDARHHIELSLKYRGIPESPDINDGKLHYFYALTLFKSNSKKRAYDEAANAIMIWKKLGAPPDDKWMQKAVELMSKCEQ